MVIVNYELLMKIHGGSSSVEPLSYGISSDMNLPDTPTADVEVVDVINDDATIDTFDHSTQKYSSELTQSEVPVVMGNTEGNGSKDENVLPKTGTTHPPKRLLPISTLIDDKRKRWRKLLSAAQCDKILMKDAKVEPRQGRI